MTILHSHNRISTSLQLAVITLMYTREIMLLFGLVSLTSPLYYGAIGLILLWNAERLMVKGIREKGHLLFWGFLAVLGLSLVTESWKHPGALISTAGRMITVLFFLNVLRGSIRGDRILLRYNTWWNILYALIMGVMCLSNYSYNDSHQLVFCYGNPNLSGLSGYICLLNLLVGLYVCRPNGERLLTCFAILACLCVCLLSRARASLLGVGAFAVMAPLLYRLRNRKTRKVLVLGAALVPLLFPPFWILFYKLVGDPQWTLFGKVVFSYRELIWDYMYDILLQNPFAVHMGQAVEHGSGPHNVPLAMWWEYGLAAFVLFNAVWFLFLSRLQDKMRFSADCVIVAALASAAVSFTFEVLLFSGGLNFSFRLFYLSAFLNLIRDGAARLKDLISLRSLKAETLGVGKVLLGLGSRAVNRYLGEDGGQPPENPEP